MVWKSVTGQKKQRERQICDRCGRQMALDGWYWSTAGGVQEGLLVVLEGVEEGGTFLDRCWEGGEVRVGETLIMGVAGWLEGLAGPALVQFLGNERWLHLGSLFDRVLRNRVCRVIRFFKSSASGQTKNGGWGIRMLTHESPIEYQLHSLTPFPHRLLPQGLVSWHPVHTSVFLELHLLSKRPQHLTRATSIRPAHPSTSRRANPSNPMLVRRTNTLLHPAFNET